MEETIRPEQDCGLATLSAIAGFYRIAADPGKLARDLCIHGRDATGEDLLRAAKSLGLRSRVLPKVDQRRLARIPAPAIVRTREGRFAIYGGAQKGGMFRLVDPVTRVDQSLELADLFDRLEPMAILISRKSGGAGADPRTIGFRWFVPSLARYRKPFAQVLLASLFIQIFALAAPLFFQITVDKVLAHKGYETLTVLVVGLVLLGVFDAVLQYLRTYTLSHTTNRMDVELGMRLFRHLLRLPISYFETRAAGQIVARMRELETIRAFVTGQALFSVLDLAFAAVMLAVLFAYSWQLALIVTATIPIYIAIALVFRPPLRDMINEKFDRGAESQQFLVESVIGIQTLKAASVEPIVSAQWEEKLAGYVRQAFKTTMLGASGQGIIQFVGKMSNAVLLLFGAKAVMDGALTIGELIAFNMLAGQIAQPVLRLSQLWQDFQQARVSIERLGDILNANPEPAIASGLSLPQCRGAITFQNVTFRYPSAGAPALNDVSFTLEAGETIGIVGASGSGKSTLAKLVQRFYIPEEGRILLDGADLAHLDPSWLRGNIGVVLQDSTLFNRTVYENIALANPVMPRSQVVAAARLAGADEFIAKLPKGYDTLIEERGGNLSGGQRQRIALARALAPNPRILILDEATSALDYESERLIQLNMRQIAANRTVIIIAHRLAAVRDCHRIIGMQNGRIVEVGPHDDLVGRAKGLYASLWNLQSERLAA